MKKIAILTICILLTSCKVGRFVYYNFADITDHKIFQNRELKKSDSVYYFKNNPKNINLPFKSNTYNSFEDMLEKSKTVGFMVIKNDSILYEKYTNKYQQESIVASFSMAKSITSILIGIAIDEGKIKSVKEPITNYIDGLKPELQAVTIEHLLQMTSGLKINENYYNPFGNAASFYYGKHLEKQMKKLKLSYKPGEVFSYKSGDTQMLGLVLAKALKTETISQYLQRKLWQPLGMEFDASWSIDQNKNGLEKTFCCINARMRDFAKIGQLYLQKGQWQGKTIVSENWVNYSTTPSNTAGGTDFYQYQWWIPNKNGDFMAKGILGQFIYVNPKKNIVMVRLGKDYGNINWTYVFTELSKKL
jgi:CubicO group peptidase (beta-lactamase class C family)